MHRREVESREGSSMVSLSAAFADFPFAVGGGGEGKPINLLQSSPPQSWGTMPKKIPSMPANASCGMRSCSNKDPVSRIGPSHPEFACFLTLLVSFPKPFLPTGVLWEKTDCWSVGWLWYVRYGGTIWGYRLSFFDQGITSARNRFPPTSSRKESTATNKKDQINSRRT